MTINLHRGAKSARNGNWKERGMQGKCISFAGYGNCNEWKMEGKHAVLVT